MKKITVLGSTGSIGTQTLEIIKNNPDQFTVLALTCNNNIELFLKQIDEFKPKYVAIANLNLQDELQNSLPNNSTIIKGIDCINEVASLSESDLIVNALVGISGFMPTISAIKNDKNIALANKESLVVGGSIIKNLLKQHNSHLIPVDSEHSAIFQCLKNAKNPEIDKLILTASGGPFFDKEVDFNSITPAQALKHPTWTMGKKVSIDSATMMNKGFEIIEAHFLFDVVPEKIDVVIQKESIVHSMVQFIDGSIIAQLCTPTMLVPIQYALTYPYRLPLENKTDFGNIGCLNFAKPDYNKFKCLTLAKQAIKAGGIMPIALNSANEVLVEMFLENKIKFLDIANLIEKVLNNTKNYNNYNIEDVLGIDSGVREYTLSLIK